MRDWFTAGWPHDAARDFFKAFTPWIMWFGISSRGPRLRPWFRFWLWSCLWFKLLVWLPWLWSLCCLRFWSCLWTRPWFFIRSFLWLLVQGFLLRWRSFAWRLWIAFASHFFKENWAKTAHLLHFVYLLSHLRFSSFRRLQVFHITDQRLQIVGEIVNQALKVGVLWVLRWHIYLWRCQL